MKAFNLLFLLIINFLLINSSLYALKGGIDSLESQINSSNGIEKIDLLNLLSTSYLNQKPDKTVELATEAFEMSKLALDTKRQAFSLYNIGEGYRMLGENLKALDFFLHALKMYEQISDKDGIAKSSDNIGVMYRFLGEYATALDYHLKALNIYKELKSNTGIASSLINAGVVYRNLGKSEIALENYNEALRISLENNYSSQTVNALISLGNIYWYDGDNDKALSNYEEALDIINQDDYEGDNSAGVFNNIGNVYRTKGDFNKAFEYYNKSLVISREIGDKNLIAVALKNIGVNYKESGKYSLAIQYFNESRTLAEQIQLLRILKEDFDHLSQTYTLLADYKTALKYFTEYSKLKDSLFDEETSNKISLLQLGYKIKEKEQQETIVEKDIEIKSTKERNILYTIIFILILVVITAIVIWSRYRLKIKSNRELKKLNSDLEKRVEERTKRLREENEHRRIAQEQAELANETKNRFLATISHEVRTPINAIIGFCDLTIKSNIDPAHQKNLQRVKDSSEHLLSLIKDVLDYSQIESGNMELKNVTFDLNELVVSIVNAFYLDAESKGIKLSHQIAGSIPKFVIGDPDVIRQILYNLIGNALKFTDKGEVDISAKIENNINDEGKIKLGFSVRDSGIGISKLKQKLIFKDFTQIDSSSNRKYGGAGLGLTICKYFVELMEGEIWVESDKGNGSNFIFTIALEVDKEKAVKTIIDKPPEINALHILVAEDNLLNAQVVVAFLKRIGHTSEVANNGKEALEVLAKKDFDAVLMDIEMPEMDGIEATEAIRAGKENVRNSEIPVIALTAHALKDYEDKSFEAGMNNYLTKPVDIDKLAEMLQTI